MARTAESCAGAAVNRSIGDRFDEVAAANRQRIAIVTPHGEIRYGALASLSDRIAFNVGKRLAARRATGSAPIAVLLPQGIAAIAAQLGILKAGACYVPLDPCHPAAHLRQTIGHAEASLVVTDSKLADLAARVVGDARAVIDVDDLPRRGWGGAKPPRVGAGSLAYLYYTSGTTGRPKGVADSHRNVLHNVQRYTRTLGIGRGDRLSLVQSPSFSGAVSSTYAALLNGGTLCAYDLHADGPAGLADWLAAANVTIYHSVPALFRALVAGHREFPAMRIVRLEGDRALAADAAIFRACFPASSILVNGLGTTETGIVRQFFVSRDTPIEDGLLPVGYAVPDVGVFIVDEGGQRVGYGVAGEIVVQSRFLAVGYWKDPQRTADKFRLVNDEGGERTYRTGDLGRMRVDGCLEHLGRRDDIVKIRGQSVDPSIVEAALVGISGVADAAAATRRSGNGECELIAIVVARAGERPTLTQIGAALREQLPDCMVPTTMIVRDTLPVTASGKVDRAAIARLAADPVPSLECGSKPPRTALEMEIAAIWRDVLACEIVPGDVAFLEMGGNSLQAMQILVHVRERLGVDMSTAEFFALPTVASQARFLETCAIGAAGAAPRQ